jgi:hypothetical protein
MQDDNPVAYYGRKLNSAQCNYATIDKELLCVVVTFKEFQSMFLGAELHIYTDHKNILNVGNLSEQGLHWISYVDKYDPNIHYIEGPCNVIADTFSKLSCKDVPSRLVGKKATYVVQLGVRVIIFILDRRRRNTPVFLKPPMLPSQQ